MIPELEQMKAVVNSIKNTDLKTYSEAQLKQIDDFIKQQDEEILNQRRKEVAFYLNKTSKLIK
jgi:hypothetical protein